MTRLNPPDFILCAADGQSVDDEYAWYGASTADGWESAEAASEWADEPREYVMYEATYREVGRRSFPEPVEVDDEEAAEVQS